MEILSIGNSFSQDAQRYLNRIAKADGVVLNTFNRKLPGNTEIRRSKQGGLGSKKVPESLQICVIGYKASARCLNRSSKILPL